MCLEPLGSRSRLTSEKTGRDSRNITAAEALLRGLSMLVVDDTPAVANALQALLEELGVAVVGPVANTGR